MCQGHLGNPVPGKHQVARHHQDLAPQLPVLDRREHRAIGSERGPFLGEEIGNSLLPDPLLALQVLDDLIAHMPHAEHEPPKTDPLQFAADG